jgi:hypothetical protein
LVRFGETGDVIQELPAQPMATLDEGSAFGVGNAQLAFDMFF